MILVVLQEGGCWQTLSTLRKYGRDRLQAEQRGKAGDETVEDKKTTDLPAVRVKDPKTQPHRRRYH